MVSKLLLRLSRWSVNELLIFVTVSTIPLLLLILFKMSSLKLYPSALLSSFFYSTHVSKPFSLPFLLSQFSLFKLCLPISIVILSVARSISDHVFNAIRGGGNIKLKMRNYNNWYARNLRNEMYWSFCSEENRIVHTGSLAYNTIGVGVGKSTGQQDNTYK